MPKTIGNPEYGINQPEKSFDYDRFIPTSPPPLATQDFENDYPESNTEEVLDAFAGVLNDNNPTNETNLSRSSRYPFNNQRYGSIKDIQTICPDQTKSVYESNRLFCTDLRKINIISININSNY